MERAGSAVELRPAPKAPHTAHPQERQRSAAEGGTRGLSAPGTELSQCGARAAQRQGSLPEWTETRPVRRQGGNNELRGSGREAPTRDAFSYDSANVRNPRKRGRRLERRSVCRRGRSASAPQARSADVQFGGSPNRTVMRGRDVRADGDAMMRLKDRRSKTLRSPDLESG